MCARKRSSDTYEFPFIRLAVNSFSSENSFSSCGIALISGVRVPGDCFEGDVWHEVLMIPISSELVQKLCATASIAGSEEDQNNRSGFMNLLIVHPDAKLRASAAAYEDLSRESIKSFLKDPSLVVRRTLSRNSSAVGQMSTSDLIDFVRKSPELSDDLMKSLLEYLEEISSEYKYRKSRRASSVYEFDRVGRLPMLMEKCGEKAGRLIEACRSSSDLKVAELACVYEARLHKLINGSEASGEFQLREILIGCEDRICSREYEYALAYMTDAEGTLDVDWILPLFVLSEAQLAAIASELPAGASTDGILRRLGKS